MVASGLESRVEVSQYRLATHLGVALLLLGALWWTALDVQQGTTPGASIAGRRNGRSVWIAGGLFGLVCLQLILGAFVAGLRGGRLYTGWPLINGKLVPDAYGSITPFWRNWFENPLAAQIDHRFVGYLVALIACAAPFLIGRVGSLGVRRVAWAVAGVALAQAALGITTLVNAAPVGLSAAHQLGGVALFLTALTLLRASLVVPAERQVVAS
jgi:cytochrome c oxidase assembly protein subunit 15